MLSSGQYHYIKSQKDKLGSSFNKSQDLDRIKEKIAQAFGTFELILKSTELSQEQKDEMISHGQFHGMLMDLINHDSLATVAESKNQLAMAKSCLERGLEYFERRYSKINFYHDKIEEFKKLIDALHMVSDQEAKEEEALTFYKVRGKMQLPPKLEPHQTDHIAMCIICWNHHASKGKDNAIKGIRHKKHCPYDKNDLDRCITDIPPYFLPNFK